MKKTEKYKTRAIKKKKNRGQSAVCLSVSHSHLLPSSLCLSLSSPAGLALFPLLSKGGEGGVGATAAAAAAII